MTHADISMNINRYSRFIVYFFSSKFISFFFFTLLLLWRPHSSLLSMQIYPKQGGLSSSDLWPSQANQRRKRFQQLMSIPWNRATYTHTAGCFGDLFGLQSSIFFPAALSCCFSSVLAVFEEFIFTHKHPRAITVATAWCWGVHFRTWLLHSSPVSIFIIIGTNDTESAECFMNE